MQNTPATKTFGQPPAISINTATTKISTPAVSSKSSATRPPPSVSHHPPPPPSLTQVCLDGCDLGQWGAQALAAFISNAQCAVTPLSLDACYSGGLRITTLLEGCGNNVNITCLNLGSNLLGGPGNHSVIYLLVNLLLNEVNKIRELDLSNNLLDCEDVRRLADVLRLGSTLLKFKVNDCDIDAEGVSAIAHALESDMTLQEINMCGARLRGLARMLTHNKNKKKIIAPFRPVHTDEDHLPDTNWPLICLGQAIISSNSTVLVVLGCEDWRTGTPALDALLVYWI